jgi:hypothetical protein
MGSHPLNLLLRFGLELVALYAVGAVGHARVDGPLRWLAALAAPLLFATLWGTFAVPDDPSRSGGAPVPVGGAARLALELGLFAVATAALSGAGAARGAAVFALVVLAHYAASWDRIAWLLAR